MAQVTDRTTLIKYCLRKLGAPVVEINVDIDQINDRLDDAFQFWQQYHYDSSVRVFLSHQVTQQNLDDNAITIPDSMFAVTRLLQMPSGVFSGDDLGNPQYQFMLNDLNTGNGLFGFKGGCGVAGSRGSGGVGPLGEMTILNQYFSDMQNTFQFETPISFSRHTNQIVIHGILGDMVSVGEYMMIDGLNWIDPAVYSDVYNDMWLKRYATALIKQNWGQNMIKFEGISLPGGVTMNGRQIYDDAFQEIEKLEEEIQDKWQLPPCGFIG